MSYGIGDQCISLVHTDYSDFSTIRFESYYKFGTTHFIWFRIYLPELNQSLILIPHSYYFKGPTASLKDYLNPANFDRLRDSIAGALAPVRASSNPGLPVWIGETSDAYDSGTVNVSDRFASGFLYVWLSILQWRHDGRDGVSNHQPHGCLLNRLIGCRQRKH